MAEPRRSRSLADRAAIALAVIALFGVVYVALAYFALDAFPFSGDEYSASLQGELFARGLLHAPAPAHADWLGIDHVIFDEWVRSKYPPGGPALLAIGARFGAAWLVTPVVATAALVVAWHAMRRALGARAALAGTIVLGAAPLFAFNAATFYSHAPATLALAGAFACVGAWTRKQREPGPVPGEQHRRRAVRFDDVWLVGAGLAIGCAFAIRPVDALLFGAAMVALRSPRALVVTAVSALPLVALVLAYQNAQFGSPFTDGYSAYAPVIEKLYGPAFARTQISWRYVIDPQQLWNHVDLLRSFALEWTVPGTVVIAVVGALAIGRDHPARKLRDFAIALVATFAVVLFATIADHDDGARPRYLSITLVPVAFLCAAGFAPASAWLTERLGGRARTAVIVAAIVLALAQLGAFLERRVPEVIERAGLYHSISERNVARDAVVIVRARFPSRYARNGPFFDGVLYLAIPPATSVGTVMAAFPNREIYEAHEGERWIVDRVR